MEARYRNAGRTVLSTKAAFIHRAHGARTTPFPAAIFAVPIIVIVDLEDLPTQVFNSTFTVCAKRSDLKSPFFFIAKASIKARLNSELTILWTLRDANAF